MFEPLRRQEGAGSNKGDSDLLEPTSQETYLELIGQPLRKRVRLPFRSSGGLSVMRHIFFLLVSLALHVAVLSYPFFVGRHQAQALVPVVVVTWVEANEPGGDGAGNSTHKENSTREAAAPGRLGNVGADIASKSGKAERLTRPSQVAATKGRERGKGQAHNAGGHAVKPEHEMARGPKHEVAILKQQDEVPTTIGLASPAFGGEINSVIPPSPRAGAESQNIRGEKEETPAAGLPNSVQERPPIHAMTSPPDTDDDPLSTDAPSGGLAATITEGIQGGGPGPGSIGLSAASGGGGGDSASASGGGLVSGSGFGSGSGGGSGRSQFVHVRYAHTPRPDYPEQARREGREGRVLLRVLIDEQGRSKSAEISESSGSELLDMAAIEGIKRWRFRPARYGNEPVQSWVRIPIEFRLSEANP